MKEYRIKDADIHEFLHFIMEDGGKLPADFDLLQKSGNYIIHVDGEKAFCLKEREAYLKDSMKNLMARSLPYFSDMRVSFSVHIKDKTGKADIAVLDNHKLSKEIMKKQARGKSLTIRYRSGKTKSSRPFHRAVYQGTIRGESKLYLLFLSCRYTDMDAAGYVFRQGRFLSFHLPGRK